MANSPLNMSLHQQMSVVKIPQQENFSLQIVLKEMMQESHNQLKCKIVVISTTEYTYKISCTKGSGNIMKAG